MTSIRKSIHCISMAVWLAALLVQTNAFTTPFAPFTSTSAPTTPERSTTALEAASRRGVLGKIRGALVGAATLAVFRQGPSIALADDSAPTTGRIVELQVANLDGVEGKTGTVKIQLRPEWAPRGVQRFEELTEIKFFDDTRVFRVLPGFVAQFGINGDPQVQSQWRSKSIPDDPVKVSNTRGTVVFATAGPNTRTTQIFVNTRQEGNAFLDRQGFSPFGQVIEGMDIVDQLYAGYGEGQPAGKGPNQGLIQAKGNAYLKDQYPKLSYIKEARFAK
mmetsp:Transcript_120938/g.170154  ORF Transcript_120938/g.170154 Transcript_120938/m.170154 type:complete len:276 (+) Transcript_120938:153-980(+)